MNPSMSITKISSRPLAFVAVGAAALNALFAKMRRRLLGQFNFQKPFLLSRLPRFSRRGALSARYIRFTSNAVSVAETPRVPIPRKRDFALLRRWLKFNAVGAMGICVQLLAVYLFGYMLEADSLWATALAVEAAVLNNFFWHEHFTWTDRRVVTRRHLLYRLLGFNATTGVVSIAGNLLFVSLLMREVHAPLLAANLLAVVACSLINFVVSDTIVFRGVRESTQTTAPIRSFSVRARRDANARAIRA